MGFCLGDPKGEFWSRGHPHAARQCMPTGRMGARAAGRLFGAPQVAGPDHEGRRSLFHGTAGCCTGLIVDQGTKDAITSSVRPGAAEVMVQRVNLRQWVLACVVAADGTTAEELDAFCLESAALARFKRPREYRFLDELPKSPSGKILRRKLREGSEP